MLYEAGGNLRCPKAQHVIFRTIQRNENHIALHVGLSTHPCYLWTLPNVTYLLCWYVYF